MGYITKKCEIDDLKNIMQEVSYSGERYLIQTKDGMSLALVPKEDLAFLEEFERSSELGNN